MEKLNLVKGLNIIGLGLYYKKLDALILSDLHIGYEEVLAEQGIHLPRTQYKKMKKIIEMMIKETNPEAIILVGDIKHEFGEITRQEWVEVKDLIKFLKENVKEIHVIRGNHDNFLIPILKKEGIPLHDPYLFLNDILFIHGHKKLDLSKINANLIIMGHEHPAVALRDELGIKHKFKCLLFGNYKEKRIIVLPAFSPLMPGSEVNIIPREKLLSPILKDMDIDEFRVFVSEPNIGIYDFGKLKNLRF